MVVSRIALFAIVLFAILYGVALVVDARIEGDVVSAQQAVNYLLSRYLPIMAVVLVVFTVFGRLQEQRPFVCALLVIVLEEIIGAAHLYCWSLIHGFGWPPLSSPLWWLDYVSLIGTAMMGTAIGLWLRRKAIVGRG